MLEVLQTFASVVTQTQAGEIALQSSHSELTCAEALIEGRVMDPETGTQRSEQPCLASPAMGIDVQGNRANTIRAMSFALHHAAGCEYSSDKRVKI
jgi:hypothetical protein